MTPLLRQLCHRPPVRLLWLAAALTVCVCAAASADAAALRAELATVLAHPSLKGATVGAKVIALPSGSALFSLNAQKPLLPASNMKLAVTAAALQLLGPEFRFTASVWGAQPRQDGVARGDIFLEGDCDPCSGPDVYTELARQMCDAGVRAIEGAVIGCRPVLVAESTPLVAARALHTALGKVGIAVFGGCTDGVAPEAPALLAQRQSEPLKVIVRRINKPSDNQMADMLLQSLVSMFGGQGQDGSFLREAWSDLGLETAGLVIADGSGYSRRNRLSAAFIAALLAQVAADPGEYTALRDSLPIAGSDGTLSERMRGTRAAGIVRAKTGTLTGVSALSGYVEVAGEQRLAFSFLINGQSCPTQTARRQLDRAVIRLARYASAGP